MPKSTMIKARKSALAAKYRKVRKYSEALCKPLKTEDYVVQPIDFVSPPKWHLGHVTWFFETLVLKPFLKRYKEFDPQFGYVFNSYYETVGKRVNRAERGNLSRPAVSEIFQYRKYVDSAMFQLFDRNLPEDVLDIIETGLNHEQQHQELLLTDIKYILGNNPLFPAYDEKYVESGFSSRKGMVKMTAGLYEAGYRGTAFCYDNELEPHKVYLDAFGISNGYVTNGEYETFIRDGGYRDFNLWHSDGWKWVNQNHIDSPLYWHFINGRWYEYTLGGLKPLDRKAPVKHVSYYEAFAYAQWKGMRLPTEFEWEAASGKFNWGSRWEWTESSYLPYPGYKKLPGALGEYNGKFMVGQKVLRGASVATPAGHSRNTYRNFFYPHERWQYIGIRLAK